MKNYQALVWMIMKIKFHHDDKMKLKFQRKLEDFLIEMFSEELIFKDIMIITDDCNPNLLVFNMKYHHKEDGISTKYQYTILLKPDLMESVKLNVLGVGGKKIQNLIESKLKDILLVEIGDIETLI